MSRDPHALHLFALVVVESDDGRFLLVQERKHGQAWYLPAGRVDPGEDFPAAALRETLEEAGLPIRLTGVLRVEHAPATSGAGRMRTIFVARPSSTRAPKSTADEHSLQAAWFTLAEIKALPLRGPEAYDWCAAVAAGAPAAPLSLFTAEGRRP